MNVIKLWRFIANSLDEGVSLAGILADGKITKDEFNNFVLNIIQLINNALEVRGFLPMNAEITGKLLKAIIQNKDLYEIIKAYVDSQKSEG